MGVIDLNRIFRQSLLAAAALVVAPASTGLAVAAQAPAPAQARVTVASEDERLMALFEDDQRREDALDPIS